MKHIPNTPLKMHAFMTLHEGMHFLEDKCKSACKCLTMPVLQLDSLFMITRSIHHHSAIFKVYMQNSIKNNFKIFGELPIEFQRLITDGLFIKDMAQYMFDDLQSDMDYTSYLQLMTEVLETLFKYNLTLHPYTTITENVKYKQTIIDYLQANTKLLENFFKLVYEETYAELNKLLPNGNRILDLCAKTNITESEQKELQVFIAQNINLAPNYHTDVVLTDYYEFITDEENNCWDAFTSNEANDDPFWDIPEQDNIYADWPVPLEQEPFGNSFCSTAITGNSIYSSGITGSRINGILSKINMQLADEKNIRYMHGVIECFIEHEFFTTMDMAADILLNIFLTERETVGFTNKYDTITLYDHYTLITMANDINVSYQKFMEELAITKRVPYEYPVEILLRIFSRLFNVIITLYFTNLIPMLIDNTLTETNVKHICIYQYSVDSYYNIIYQGEPFTPVAQDQTFIPRKKSTVQTSNDLNDIVEV